MSISSIPCTEDTRRSFVGNAINVPNKRMRTESGAERTTFSSLDLRINNTALTLIPSALPDTSRNRKRPIELKPMPPGEAQNGHDSLRQSSSSKDKIPKHPIPTTSDNSPSARLPKKMLPFQKHAITVFQTPKPLSAKELQDRTCKLFIKMAAEVAYDNHCAIPFAKMALELNPTPNEKARLLMNCATAYFKKKDFTSIEKAIFHYQEGIQLQDIPDPVKARFYCNLGYVYLLRKKPGDSVKAMKAFEEGLKKSGKDSKLIGDLFIGMGNVAKQHGKEISIAIETKDRTN